MAFTDPLTLTPGAAFDAGAVSLARTSTQGTISIYTGVPSVNAGAFMRVTSSHQYGKRNRHVLRLDYGDNVGATLTTGTTSPRGVSTYLVLDTPAGGQFSTANHIALINGLKGTWSASSDALLTKWCNGES